MLISYLSIQTCACQLILIHVDKIFELEMADFCGGRFTSEITNCHQYFGFCVLFSIMCGMCEVCIMTAPSLYVCIFMLLIDYVNFML